MATWTGRTYSNDKCSYTLLKQADGTLYLKENNTNNYFNCSKQTIKNSTDYYFVDPDIADINVNLACFNLKKEQPYTSFTTLITHLLKRNTWMEY